MIWNNWIRQTHRWLSIAFTLTVVANFVALGLGKQPLWLVYSPLAPLFLLLFSGRLPFLWLPARAALWLVVILALVSGIAYFHSFWREIYRAAPAPAPAPKELAPLPAPAKAPIESSR